MTGIRRTWAGALGPVVTTAMAAMLAAACGVSTNDEPQPIARDNVPSELLETDVESGDALATNGGGLQPVPVWYLIDVGGTIQLHPVDRGVPAPTDQPSRRIDALLDPAGGPTEAERREGISTAIPSEVRLTAIPTQDGTVLEVSLSDEFYDDLSGNNFIYAVAQLVFTATEVPSVRAVRFLDQDGQRVAVQDSDGESHQEPVGRDEYETLYPTSE